MKTKITCPVGLAAIVTELAKIIAESAGKLTISFTIHSAKGTTISAPWITVLVWREKAKRKDKWTCQSFMFDETTGDFYRAEEANKNWTKMLNYINKAL